MHNIKKIQPYHSFNVTASGAQYCHGGHDGAQKCNTRLQNRRAPTSGDWAVNFRKYNRLCPDMKLPALWQKCPNVAGQFPQLPETGRKNNLLATCK